MDTIGNAKVSRGKDDGNLWPPATLHSVDTVDTKKKSRTETFSAPAA
jgi:hypothetical protein